MQHLFRERRWKDRCSKYYNGHTQISILGSRKYVHYTQCKTRKYVQTSYRFHVPRYTNVAEQSYVLPVSKAYMLVYLKLQIAHRDIARSSARLLNYIQSTANIHCILTPPNYTRNSISNTEPVSIRVLLYSPKQVTIAQQVLYCYSIYVLI